MAGSAGGIDDVLRMVGERGYRVVGTAGQLNL